MFQGYTQETVDFMWGIRFNNERGWFLEHKQQYQTQLLEPTRALGEQVYEGVQAMLPREPLMLKTSRIYRDARRLFGRGPYRDRAGVLQLRHGLLAGSGGADGGVSPGSAGTSGEI